MTNDNQFKPVFKSESEIPKTYEQFLLENRQFNELISNSYQTEYEAEVSQGPQYGPGRKDFRDFVKKIKDSLGVNAVTGRISCSSDEYQPNKKYAGVIIYAMDGEFSWTNSGGDARGRRGRSFYVIIKCTDPSNGWPANASSYGGMVHGYLVYKALGINITVGNNGNKICAGGFSYENDELKFNSWTFNSKSIQGVCESDGKKCLSDDEKNIVRYCWDQYASRGTAHTFEMPLTQDWNTGGGN